jgi:hypothetical protein
MSNWEKQVKCIQICLLVCVGDGAHGLAQARQVLYY